MKIRRTWLPLVAGLLAATLAQAQTDVLVSHYDDARTSSNLSETTLTTANVNSAGFGKVYALPVDGMVFAQPLFKSNLNFSGLGTFNVLFVATEHSSIYAIDADSATPIWHRSFINPAAGLTTRTTVPAQEDIVPEVSITSTPVIDATTGTMYVVAETQQGGSPPYYWLHALDITTGQDKVAPTIIQASISTGAIPFRIDAQTSQQRASLVLSNGVVYVGFGSSGDSYPWIGWLVGYDAATLARVTVFCTSTSGNQGAGVWSSGEAPPLDSSGNLFVSTGNGYFSPTAGGAWGDSILKLSTAGGLAVADSFTPFNQAALDAADLDLASAGMTLLPDAVGTAAHPHLMVASGKDGEVYVLDRDNMGQYQSSYTTPNSQIVQWLPYGATSGTPAVGVQPVIVTNATLPYRNNSYHSPAYWNNRVYFCGLADSCKLFTLSGGQLSLLPTSMTVATFPYAGAQPTISAASSSASSAILWAVQCSPDCRAGGTVSILHAYDATNLSTELYNSSQAAGGRDTGAAPVKFPKPTVANGRVFVPTTTEVDVYGLLASNPPRLAAPSFTPTPGTYTSVQSVSLSGPAGATIYYTLDGSVPTLGSSQYTGPLSVGASTTIKAMAVHSGSLTSTVASGAFTISSTTQITYVQSNYATPQTTQTTVPVKFSAAQLQGDLNVVVVGWNDATVAVSTVTDTSGNTYVRAVGPTVLSGTATQSIYYAANIGAAAAGANTVTVLFNAAAAAADVRILEYSGIATTSPLDAAVGATGSGPTVSSGTATTTGANDLIIGADLTTGDTTGPGTGFTSRMITVPDADIVEDMTVTSAGSYSATAVLSAAAPTIMQMVAFKAAPTDVGNVPSAPTSLVAVAAGAASVNLTWGAASDSGSTITQYLIERCAGSSCTNFAQVNTATGLSFTDAGLTGSTNYRYRVRAKNANAQTGPYSNIAAATTPTPIPTAPTNLAATASGATQVNLSWGAASETGGAVTGYLVERCQDAGCSNFTQVGSVSGLSYTDSGLSNATSYSYRVRATDAAANPGPYSNIASATTATASPTAPTSLAVTTASTTQLNLSWAAASESGGSIAGYFIERCQGAGCSSFVQVAGPVSGLTYSDSGLANTTSYSYRVRARDGAGINGPYSSVATGTTASAVPSAPSSLAATASGSTQIGLAWGAASEAGGTISQYLIERCQGTGCSSFTQVGGSSTLGFNDTGLAGSTSYSYRVRAKDSLAVLGPYSNVSSATTAAPAISAPAAPNAAASGSSQITVKWKAATETGGTVSQYRIERCQGGGCANFAQVGTSAGLSFADAALAPLTTYRYRVRAADAAGNVGPYSVVVQSTTTSSRHWWDTPVRPRQWTPFRPIAPLIPLK